MNKKKLKLEQHVQLQLFLCVLLIVAANAITTYSTVIRVPSL